ncbi:ABC transporter ATP-binding protein [Rhizobium brockwellii]|uniref:ABC transporter ATP-binding protein n=1 Tax=Rhizobium brockwellii TaxID=3019932 RepID=A0ABU3YE02_9HYPH|nr:MULTISPECIES: ABC transporter ATP-binding protein [Rhizobium]KPN26892.1 ABC transporter ATP-binding protein [Rhizobium brockwellii]MDV4156007.1 ABC transporter ATP-binding protein [Rhizobium brockwellii]MDV4177092.1 ABC transporter ATP-binding protein [Rhizobium brockwellii]MDV4184091.1 ABC transporter ATP-binding protein [Rhizobium brockwellii]QIO51112.1 ABC transporter ATP-binding protein [Rhizobium leguminosarum bv. trifolii]
MARLILNQLGKDFGTGRAAVSSFSLDVREGGFLALLGPSGCGKTTVLRMIAGFETPSDGSIHLGERLLADAAQSLPPEKRNMAMVFQSYALWPHMSVADNVGYPLKVRGISGEAHRTKVRDALDTVRLADYAERRPADLSGGQRQRVALARCLVTSPDVVLLDEPLANLDRHLKQEMEETFREFHQRSGATMIYVTHDQSEAMALATDIAVMSEGRLLQVAAPAEIYARPEGRIVGGLIGRGAILTLPVVNRERYLEWDELQDALHAANTNGADILVRPEDVVIGVEGAPAAVESVLFEGERYAVRLMLGNGQRLRAFSRVAVVPGEAVRVVIRAGWRL